MYLVYVFGNMEQLMVGGIPLGSAQPHRIRRAALASAPTRMTLSRAPMARMARLMLLMVIAKKKMLIRNILIHNAGSGILQQLVVPGISIRKCKEYDEFNHFELDFRFQLCAGGDKG